MDEISALRHKHFQNKLLEIINRVLADRRRIVMEEHREIMRKFALNSPKKSKNRRTQSYFDPTFLTAAADTNRRQTKVAFIRRGSAVDPIQIARTQRKSMMDINFTENLFPQKKIHSKVDQVRERREFPHSLTLYRYPEVLR